MKRSKPMKRTPLKAKPRPSFSGVKPEVKRSTLKTKQRAVKPEEKALWSRLAEMGCIACMKDGHYNPHVSIHHVDGRTKPECHLKVLPLCAPHHQQDDTDPAHRISVHGNKARFEKLYGAQLDLVAECMALIGEK